MTEAIAVRRGGPGDVEPALLIWRAAGEARRGGRPASPEQGDRVRAHVENPDSFLFVAESRGAVVGMAVGMQGLADDGDGPPVRGFCHVGAVFVGPDHWGRGVGGALVDAVLAEARSHGYDRAQLWTHANNRRAHRFYESRGFRCTGREKAIDDGETIAHYARDL